MVKLLKFVVLPLCLLGLGVGGFFAWFYFYFYPGWKPVANWERAASLSDYLSQITKEDFELLHFPVPTGETELPIEQVRLLCDRLHSTGRFPGFKPGSELKDFYGNFYVITVSLPNSRSGHWSSSGGLSGPKEFIFGVCSPGHTESH